MVRLFVRHTVADFDSWKSVYDEFDATRQTLGVRGDAVFCGATEPTDVTVWHDFDDLVAARRFVASEELAAAMRRAGVQSDPEIWFVQREMP